MSSALVLKQWVIASKPVDPDGNRVVIVGRQPGFVSWILSLLGVDPTTSLKVSPERVEFVQSSLAGTTNRLLPLQGICSTFFGYRKPWKEALVLFIVLNSLGWSMTTIISGSREPALGPLLGVLAVSLLVSLLYFFLKKTLTLGFVENSGFAHMIQFRRSVIEGISIDESEARRVCDYVQALIEHKLRSLSRSA